MGEADGGKEVRPACIARLVKPLNAAHACNLLADPEEVL
jgi:hypothetical protein